MDAAFVFQAAVSSSARYHKTDLLKPAQIALAGAHQLNLPAVSLGIFIIHPEKASGEKSRFVPSGSASYFHNDVLVVVGILRYEKQLKLLLYLRQPFPVFGKLVLKQALKFLIGLFLQHLDGFLYILLCIFIFRIFFGNGRYVAVLLHEGAPFPLIRDYVRIVYKQGKLLMPVNKFGKSLKHHYPSGVR